MPIRYATPDLDVTDYQYRPPFYEFEEDGKVITFVTPTDISKHRAENILVSEPETIEWIKTFSADQCMYDIGANVGSYSLYAAIMRSVDVIAFEPESQSYSLLNHNIFRNKICKKINSFNIGISDEEGFTNLYMNYFGSGVSCSAVGQAVCNYDAYNEKGLEEFEPFHVQGVFSTTLDNLVYKHGMRLPDHIKIDVDGFEHKLINGASELLKSGQIKSLLIEINKFMPEHTAIIPQLTALGFDAVDCNTGNFIFYKKQ